MRDLAELERIWKRSPEYRALRRRFMWRVALPTMAACIAAGGAGMLLAVWAPAVVAMQYGAAFVAQRVALRRFKLAERAIEGGAP